MGSNFIFQFIEKTIDLLKDPYLVVRFQNYFGVYRIERTSNGNEASSREWLDDESNARLNGKIPCDKTKCNGSVHGYSEKDSQTVNYIGKLKVSQNGSLKNHVPTHRRDLSNSSSITSVSASETDDILSDSDNELGTKTDYRIDNMFWYYLFCFGASLGFEVFYASFFPFWFWNIDSAVCRRVINVWVFIMYIGQSSKDVIRWSRPASPPVVQLEPDYSQEYGMPSTHAMVGAAVPFSLLYFTLHRYEYQFGVGLFLAVAWCTLVCLSRLYLGMHTVLDIIGGLILVSVLMLVALPLADIVDHFQLTNPYSPLVTLSILILLAVFYPKSDRWTPARGDTAIMLGTGGGISIGSWMNYQFGIIRGTGLPPPFPIMWPDYSVVGLALLRASIGILCVVATRAFFKSITYAIVCYIVKLNPNDIKTKQRVAVEVPHKFITYVCIGIGVTYLCPFVFRLLCIERITMFTEV